MSSKTIKIIAISLMILPALMLLFSAVMKLIGAEPVVVGLTMAGLGKYIVLFGLIELVSVILFLIPKTHKIGFSLLCCYLGGALSIELAGAQFPMAALLLVVLWIGVYLRNKYMFLTSPVASAE